MSRRINYFYTGLFVIIAIIIVVIILIVLGSGSIYKHPVYAETFFSESVQGLNIGSPVKFRGVQVGDVTKITFVKNVYDLKPPDNPALYRAVYVEVELNPKELPAGNLAELSKNAIKHGLRMTLAPLGLTGTSYIEINYFPNPGKALTPPFPTQHLFIPATSSTFKQLTEEIQDLADTLQRANLDKLASNVNTLTETATQAIKDAHVDQISKSILTSLNNIQNLSDRLSRLMSVDQQAINNTLQNINEATGNIRITTQKYPSQLILSKPPPPPEPN